jgi:hypothetical protein
LNINFASSKSADFKFVWLRFNHSPVLYYMMPALHARCPSRQPTTRKFTGYSPFYMAHGVEPTLPFDLTVANFLVFDLCTPLPTADLIAPCTRQLQQLQDDLDSIYGRVLKSRFASVQQSEKQHQNFVKDHNFRPGSSSLCASRSSLGTREQDQAMILWAYGGD